MLPKTIIFDWDNTLIDVQSSLDFALTKTTNEIREEKNDKIVSNRPFYPSREDFLKGMFKNRWKEASILYDKHIKTAPIGGVSLFENAQKILKFTFDHQIPTVIVSNKFGPNLRMEIAKLNLEKYFAAVIGSGDTSEDKPSVIPAQTALGQISITSDENVWFIGDSITDMKCARKLGATRILYGPTDIKSIAADFYAQNHSELLSLFQDRV